MLLNLTEAVKISCQAVFRNRLNALTLRNIETALEDFNILNDRQHELQIESGQSVNDTLVSLCDQLDDLGFNSTWEFFNSLRMCFNAKAVFDFPITVSSILEYFRSLIGTVNTSLRYNDIEAQHDLSLR